MKRALSSASRGRGRRPPHWPALLPAILPFVAFALPASAQEPEDSIPDDSTVFEVEEITVRVARPLTTAGGASALIAALDSLRVVPSPTLAEVLRDMPLVLIRMNSRGEAQPTVRGTASRRVAVWVDGIPLTLGWDNRADLSIIPLTAARQVTLIRGLSSVLNGPNAAGALIKIGIADAPPALLYTDPLRVSASLDHLGNAATELALSTLLRGGSGDLLIRGGGGYRNLSGLPLPADVPPATSGAGGDRLNSDVEYGNAFVVGRYQGDGGAWASVSSFGFRADRGVPPELHVTQPRLWRIPNSWRWVTALSAGTGFRSTPWGEGDLEASLGLDFGGTEIESYESLAYERVTGADGGGDRTLTLRLLGDHTLGPGTLSGAFTLAETRHEEVLDPGGLATYRQRLWSLGLEAEEPLSSGANPRTQLSLGVSVDGSDTPETGAQPARDPIWEWGGRAGVTTALVDRKLLLNAGVSRRVRSPALRELYSGALGRFVVNPALQPEVFFVSELGMTAQLDRLQAQAVGFHQRISHAIVRSSFGDGRFQRVNRDELRSTGVELLIGYARPGVWVAGDVTLQNAELRDPSAPVSQREPEYQPWIAGSMGIRGSTLLDIQAGARVMHVGRQYCVHPDLDADVELSASTWLDLEVSRVFPLSGSALARRAEAIVAIDNAADSAVFDQCGLPQPGRLVRFQFRIY